MPFIHRDSWGVTVLKQPPPWFKYGPRQGLLRLLPLIRVTAVRKTWHSMCLCRDKEEKNYNKSNEHKETWKDNAGWQEKHHNNHISLRAIHEKIKWKSGKHFLKILCNNESWTEHLTCPELQDCRSKETYYGLWKLFRAS